MVVNARIAELIREGHPEEITDAIAEGEYFGMQTFEQALISRVMSGDLERDVAADAASNRHDFIVALERVRKHRAAAEAAEHEPDEGPSPPRRSRSPRLARPAPR